jgi:hypothetical protein
MITIHVGPSTYQKLFLTPPHLNTNRFEVAREEVYLEGEFDCVYLRRERGKGVGKGVLGQSQRRGT